MNSSPSFLPKSQKAVRERDANQSLTTWKIRIAAIWRKMCNLQEKKLSEKTGAWILIGGSVLSKCRLCVPALIVEDAKKASNYLIFAEIDELGLIFTDPYLSQLILKAISKRKLFFSFCGGWSDVFWVNYITAQKQLHSLVTPSEWYRSICVAMQLFFSTLAAISTKMTVGMEYSLSVSSTLISWHP